MASRSLKDNPGNPKNLGLQMRQGGDDVMPLPHGLAASMKQGSPTPIGDVKATQIGPRMRQGK